MKLWINHAQQQQKLTETAIVIFYAAAIQDAGSYCLHASQ